ncbi:hypothetical protein BUALT_Bualt15G0094100 [Buddleja alternifolia]|uniref:Protein kinase domain-containing protein n=1 Tax=Buddleja alternifolia TaxID=168488 RepID=A0AAV6WPH3_9LAMI|nr:hypothetical protein BUALT_Bualt15G0094100 [Buddleja alternifolia]
MVRNWRCSSPQPNQWLKGNVIGSGSFGTVHLAIDSATGALFVAKTANSEAGITSLKNEANILENLNCPNIIKCIGKDFSLAEKQYSLFFEYMAGGSLSDLSQKFGGVLNENLIRLYTREILQGLKYLHNNGILHSDIKCKNVLLGSSGNVKLADFGCAKRLSDKKINTKNSSQYWNFIGGTPLWMAPEVLRNERLDFAADIWSLGCTVIEMATGKSPWGGDDSNPTVIMLEIAKGNEVPQFPGNFSPEGLDFLAKCLERDYRKRWTSEKLLEHPFVTGQKASNGNSRNDNALSPTSVLDVASYDSDSNEFVSRISFFTMKFCFQEKNLMPENALEDHLELSDNWITVRSS